PLVSATDVHILRLNDLASNGYLADVPQTVRFFRLRYQVKGLNAPASRPTSLAMADRLNALDHPALSVRLESQRILARVGAPAVPALVERLNRPQPETGRLHVLWALDLIGGPRVPPGSGKA